MTITGVGVGMIPLFIASEALASGQLVQLLPYWELGEKPIVYAVYPTRNSINPKKPTIRGVAFDHFEKQPCALSFPGIRQVVGKRRNL